MGLVSRHPEYYPGLLESGSPAATGGGVGRFDILPISNGECLRLGADGLLSGPHASASGGFFDALERWWSELRQFEPSTGALPFTGGWLVYLGYELAAEIEPRLQLPPAAEPLVALALRAPAAWIRDRATMRAWLVAEPGEDVMLDRFAEHALAAPPPAARASAAIDVREDEPSQFLAAVRRALEFIAAGDVYQVNLSRQWCGRADAHFDPAALYARLRSANPSPFAVLLRHGAFAVISSSPERLVSIRDGQVNTRPIAGTRPRGATAHEDAVLIQALLDDEKERAEHVMLIDLERNDLGRICTGGSVRVSEYMSIETYAHVHHIVSNVSGRLRAGVSPVEAVRAVFPGGTITGCPKVRCMQIIAQLEGTGRGAYTGAVGYLNRDGSCDFNILIRTISAAGGAIRFRAGAGIVADSNPERELAETRAKAEGMLRALGNPASHPR